MIRTFVPLSENFSQAALLPEPLEAGGRAWRSTGRAGDGVTARRELGMGSRSGVSWGWGHGQGRVGDGVPVRESAGACACVAGSRVVRALGRSSAGVFFLF